MVTTTHKRSLFILASCSAILLIPFIAMQFTDEVVWTAGDFLVAALLLGTAGLFIEVLYRNMKNSDMRGLTLAFIVILLVLVWAELAVGIFGTPLAGS
ncbi:MAG: hypothetical protein AAFW89_11075 [Bacteroidota bacterium]